MIAAAIMEEILFRGLLQTWLVRIFGPGPASVAAAIVLTSLVWAIAHAANATPMLPKLLQVFVLGLLLGALVRRYDVEACIVAHATLNVVAVLVHLVHPVG